MKRVCLFTKPKIEADRGKVKLSSVVKCGTWEKELYYEVDEKYTSGLCAENIDAFVVAMLPWCMINSTKENPLVLESDAKISKQLLMQLKSFYIPIVSKSISYCESIDINIKSYDNVASPNGVAVTGVSGGVDSFYTLIKFTQPDCEYPITHGICANMGVYGGYEGEPQIQLQHVAEDVCSAMGLELINVKSNIMLDVYKKQMATNVSYIYMSMGLALQNFIDVYYFSSEVEAEKFNFNEINAEEYDLFNVHMFSNERIKFYSSGSEVTRLEKIDMIAEYPITYQKIQVCPTPINGKQCQKCMKCTETMCALDAVGKLNRYSKIYDIEEYKKNYAYHWGYILLSPKTVPNLKEILVAYKKRCGRIKFSAYIACIKKWISRGCSRDNKKRITIQDIIERPEL